MPILPQNKGTNLVLHRSMGCELDKWIELTSRDDHQQCMYADGSCGLLLGICKINKGESE